MSSAFCAIYFIFSSNTFYFEAFVHVLSDSEASETYDYFVWIILGISVLPRLAFKNFEDQVSFYPLKPYYAMMAYPLFSY